MNRKAAALLVLAALGLGAAPAHAQKLQAGVEGRGGVAIPTGDFADAASVGFGFEGAFLLHFSPMFSAYAGWTWNRFGCDESACDPNEDVDFTDSGFDLGVRGAFTTGGPFEPWIRAGVVLHVVEISGSDGNTTASIESERGTGFEVGGGFRYWTRSGVTFSPGIRYTSYETDLEVPGFGTGEVEVDHLVLDLGIGFTF